MKTKYNSGQAILIVLLSMAVILTIVLSVLSRSITDISISTQDEDSLRAFSAAEAGVEKALIGTVIGSAELGNANYSFNVSAFAEGEKEFNNSSQLFSGESLTTWFVAHDSQALSTCSADKPCFTGDTLKVCWGKPGTDANLSVTPALELVIFYTPVLGDYSSTLIAREAIDPNSSRRVANSFSQPDSGNCTISGETYQFQKTLNLGDAGIPAGTYNNQNGLQFMIIRSLYNTNESNSIGISVNFPNNSVLPSQGMLIDSKGSSGNANRKIEVFNSFREIPEVFEFGVYSQIGVTK